MNKKKGPLRIVNLRCDRTFTHPGLSLHEKVKRKRQERRQYELQTAARHNRKLQIVRKMGEMRKQDDPYDLLRTSVFNVTPYHKDQTPLIQLTPAKMKESRSDSQIQSLSVSPPPLMMVDEAMNTTPKMQKSFLSTHYGEMSGPLSPSIDITIHNLPSPSQLKSTRETRTR